MAINGRVYTTGLLHNRVCVRAGVCIHDLVVVAGLLWCECTLDSLRVCTLDSLQRHWLITANNVNNCCIIPTAGLRSLHPRGGGGGGAWMCNSSHTHALHNVVLQWIISILHDIYLSVLYLLHSLYSLTLYSFYSTRLEGKVLRNTTRYYDAI